MVEKDEEWVGVQGLAAAQSFRKMIQQPGAMLGVELQALATNIVRVAFIEGLKRGEYKCVAFLITTGEGYQKMGFGKDSNEFIKASKTVKDQLDRKYEVDLDKEVGNAARNTFRN